MVYLFILFLLQFEAVIALMKSSDLRIALYTRIGQNHLGTHHSSLSRSQRASGRLDVFWRRTPSASDDLPGGSERRG